MSTVPTLLADAYDVARRKHARKLLALDPTTRGLVCHVQREVQRELERRFVGGSA